MEGELPTQGEGHVPDDYHGNREADNSGNCSHGDGLDSGVFDEAIADPERKEHFYNHGERVLGRANSLPVTSHTGGEPEMENSLELGHESETRPKNDQAKSHKEHKNDLANERDSRIWKDELEDESLRDLNPANDQMSSSSVGAEDGNKATKVTQRKTGHSELSYSGSESNKFKDSIEAQLSASVPSHALGAFIHGAKRNRPRGFRPRSKSWSTYGAVERSSSGQTKSGESLTNDAPPEGAGCGDSNEPPEFSFRRTSTRHKLTLISLAFVNFCTCAAFALLAPFFPQEASIKGVNQGVTGMIFGSYELVIFLSSPVLGTLITKIGAKFMFVSGVFVSGVCGILFGTLDICPPGTIYIVMCFLTRTVEALGSSAVLVASFAIVAHEFPDNVATVFGGLETFSGFGMMVGPPLGGALYQAGGFGLPFFTTGSFLVACGTICIWLLPVQNHHEVPFEGSVISLFLKPSAFVITISIVIGSFGLGFLDPTLAEHFAEFNLSPFWVGLMFFLAPAVYAFTAPVFGWIGDNKGYTITMIVGGNILTSVAFVLLGPAPFLHIKLELWLEVVSLVLMGLFLGCALIPTFKALLDSASANGYPDSFATYGIVSGLFNSAFSFGSFLGPTTLGGIVNDKLGFPWTASVCALCYIIAGLLVLLQVCIQRQHAEAKKERGRADERTPILQTQFSPSDMPGPPNYACA